VDCGFAVLMTVTLAASLMQTSSFYVAPSPPLLLLLPLNNFLPRRPPSAVHQISPTRFSPRALLLPRG